ncbi:Endonuclease/exonuclease/phosphatase [Thamnocephalis sphaerospora]|uniref:Endonuclease/exonuclease/phosphatase n=1 Tax=Thamnocephalis sphaerospora TaxID=78915 RepID=A0A4P9XNP8_9FUNG|nr:Endonuclease/exonuclease/phosphatase [Thamnocephalis sphaerospora]|eukprot:RKP07594.1 Endonuclease/exonuclease/phosphatase [Thamnocephalis sphaerospora]
MAPRPLHRLPHFLRRSTGRPYSAEDQVLICASFPPITVTPPPPSPTETPPRHELPGFLRRPFSPEFKLASSKAREMDCGHDGSFGNVQQHQLPMSVGDRHIAADEHRTGSENGYQCLLEAERIALRRAVLSDVATRRPSSRLRLHLPSRITSSTPPSMPMASSVPTDTQSMASLTFSSASSEAELCSSVASSNSDGEECAFPACHDAAWLQRDLAPILGEQGIKQAFEGNADVIKEERPLTDERHAFAWNVDAIPWTPSSPSPPHSPTESLEGAMSPTRPRRTRRASRRRSRGYIAQSGLHISDLSDETTVYDSLDSLPAVASPIVPYYPAPVLENEPSRPMIQNPEYAYLFDKNEPVASIGVNVPHFKVLSWNILTQQYAQRRRFDYVPSMHLDWETRSARILGELQKQNADIVALQEMDERAYQDLFAPEMSAQGYAGVYERKRHPNLNDGCAIFYRRDKFALHDVDQLHYQESDLHEWNTLRQNGDDRAHQRDRACRFNMHHNLALIATLRNLATGGYMRVVSTHLLADPEFADAKLLQAALLCEYLERQELEAASAEGRHTADNAPIVICGDWNSLPESDVLRYLCDGRINRRAFGGHNFGRFTRARTLRHQLNLACAYSTCEASLSATTRTPQFSGEIDRILYSRSGPYFPVAVLGDLNEEHHRNSWLPNAHAPSDHLPLVVVFAEIPPIQASLGAAPWEGTAQVDAMTSAFTVPEVYHAAYPIGQMPHAAQRYDTSMHTLMAMMMMRTASRSTAALASQMAMLSTAHHTNRQMYFPSHGELAMYNEAGYDADYTGSEHNPVYRDDRSDGSNSSGSNNGGRHRGSRGRRGGRRAARAYANAKARMIREARQRQEQLAAQVAIITGA